MSNRNPALGLLCVEQRAQGRHSNWFSVFYKASRSQLGKTWKHEVCTNIYEFCQISAPMTDDSWKQTLSILLCFPLTDITNFSFAMPPCPQILHTNIQCDVETSKRDNSLIILHSSCTCTCYDLIFPSQERSTRAVEGQGVAWRTGEEGVRQGITMGKLMGRLGFYSRTGPYCGDVNCQV